MSKPLGKLLLSARAVTSAQLEEAIQNQVIYGGKLGTNLMELGYLNLAALSKVLSKKLGCPTINPFKLKPARRDLLRLLGKKLAVKHQVVPLGADEKNMDLLMANPTDVAAIDEIRFATGKRIRPYISPELVVLTLLEKYYGVPRDFRYKELAAKVLRRRPKGAPKSTTGKAAPPPQDRPGIKGLEFSSNEELTSQEDFEKLLYAYNRPHGLTEEAEEAPPEQPDAAHAPAQPPAEQAPPAQQVTPPPAEQTPVPPPQPQPTQPPPEQTVVEAEEEILDLEDMVVEPETEPSEAEAEEKEIIEELPEALTLQEAMQRLGEIVSRDELGRVVLAFALSYFKRAALFITRGGVAMGWDGMGGSLNRRTVQGIMLPLNAPSIFKTVHDSKAFYLGAIPSTPINERFTKITGNERPRSVFLIPILFGGNVVNILYGDNGAATDAPTDISDLLILAPRIPQAFETIIRKKKQEAKER